MFLFLRGGLFLGRSFLCFFLCHETIPPFDPLMRWVGEGFFVTSLTCVSSHPDFFVKHFSDIFEIIFTISRAIIFFDVREIVSRFTVSKENCHRIFVTFHSGVRFADIVRDDHVAIFLAKFFRAFVSRSCVSAAKPTTKKIAILLRERGENVARRK